MHSVRNQLTLADRVLLGYTGLGLMLLGTVFQCPSLLAPSMASDTLFLAVEAAGAYRLVLLVRDLLPRRGARLSATTAAAA